MIKQRLIVGNVATSDRTSAQPACGVAFRTETDSIFSREDKRPLKNGPLSQGIAHDGCVVRSLRDRVISIETGAAQGVDKGWTASFPVRLDGRDIFHSPQPRPDLRLRAF